MTDYLIIIEGEQFVVDAPHVLAAWEVALAKAALMLRDGELEGEEVAIEVLSMGEAEKAGIPVLFAERLDRFALLEEFERARIEEARRYGGVVEVVP